ncbi:DeoR/GlpR family DNA-binding transcription regulator [Arcticibacter sp.]|jgi:DeoR/GlpR family transcriptional regulator of sugar metabolism|uniref:DeoR/GlpR family DNA-binding transcription regulator n=1 Tax=Arcticibacter sp. TaxID=1872630 RepID=UPI00388E9446
MLKEERQAYIIKQINLHNKVLSSDLSVQLAVSEDTIRRDLNELAESGKILKVYGGALSKSFHYPFQQNEVYAKDAKKIIVQKTMNLLQNGMVLLAGGGTTMIEWARSVPDNIECTVFTVSPLVGLELTERAGVEVILIGGQLSKNSHINTGALTINLLADIKVDLCIMGTNGLSYDAGVTESDWEVVQVKKAMLKSAQKTAIISIGEKLESVQKMKICGLNAVNYLITDLDPKDPQLTRYAEAVQVL